MSILMQSEKLDLPGLIIKLCTAGKWMLNQAARILVFEKLLQEAVVCGSVPGWLGAPN